MLKVKTYAIILAIAAACSLAAAEVQITGPVAGFVFDRTAHALRPMLGVPGSAYLGDAIAGQLDAAAVSPDGNSALAAKAGKLYLLHGLKSGEPVLAELEGVVENADRMIWAGEGAAFVLSSAGKRAQFWKGLEGSPELAGTSELGDVAGEITGAAYAGGGTAALASAGGGVYVIESGKPARLLVQLDECGGIAIAGSDLLVTDRKRQQVLKAANFAGSGDVTLLAGEGQGISDPVAVAVAREKIYVASGAGRSLSVFNSVSMEFLGRMDMDFEPTRLESIGGSVFLLNGGDREAEPLQILDAGASPAVYFVPARRAAVED